MEKLKYTFAYQSKLEEQNISIGDIVSFDYHVQNYGECSGKGIIEVHFDKYNRPEVKVRFIEDSYEFYLNWTFKLERIHNIKKIEMPIGEKIALVQLSKYNSALAHIKSRWFNDDRKILELKYCAIGMGVNLPIRRIIFTESKKFDGKSKRLLNMSEVKQIAGRAGRKGMYDQGYVNSIEDRDQIGELLHGRYEQITSCVIQPPRKVLDMPYSLSEIFKIWLKTIEKKCFSVADLKNRIKLAEYIEKKHGEKINKYLEYSLINIPFDENSEKLKYLWQDLVDMTADGEPVSRMWYYVDTESEDIEAMKLDDLEQLYKKMDLLNSYCNALNISEYDERIRMLKEEITERIVRELTNGEFFNKCKRCGKKLEWNHRFGMCEKCYEINKLERMRYKADKWR